jgi:hypothetical protein
MDGRLRRPHASDQAGAEGQTVPDGRDAPKFGVEIDGLLHQRSWNLAVMKQPLVHGHPAQHTGSGRETGVAR